jgi:negative regulator of sigma E activity
MRVLLLSCPGVLVAGLLMTTPLAHADDCMGTIKSASIAQVKVPHAVVHVMTVPGKPPQRMEMVFKNDKAYTLMNGAWSSISFSAQDQLDMIKTSSERAAKTATCQRVGSEPVNGESASVFASHDDVHGKAIDAKLWLSDKTGLPLKSEVHMASGMVLTDEFRYTSVEVPAGVK